MSNAEPRDVLPSFNRALDECKGKGSEPALAAQLGTTARSIYKWRRGKLPAVVQQLMKCPETLRALAEDAEQKLPS